MISEHYAALLSVCRGHALHCFRYLPGLQSSELFRQLSLHSSASSAKRHSEQPNNLQQRRRTRLTFGSIERGNFYRRQIALRSVPNPALRRLLRGVSDYVDLQLGFCTHIRLYEKFSKAIGSPDPLLLGGIRDGFPIVEVSSALVAGLVCQPCQQKAQSGLGV